HVSPDRELTPQRFDEQIEWLAKSGYQGLTLEELLLVLRGERVLEKPSVALTFDDGYLNNYQHSFPVIKRWKIPAMIYLVTERIGTDGYLSWENIQEMQHSGLVSFGSHTHTHRGFVRKEPYQDVEVELRMSKDMIEKNLKTPCRHLAWPWGDY